MHIKIKALLALVPLATGVFISSNNAQAAERTVLLEQFTATWCVPCQSVGRAAFQLLEDNRNSIVGYQCHGGDSYTISWGNTRMSFYGVSGYPTAWMDGWNQQYGSFGSDSGNYSNLSNMMSSCQARSTDVTIESSGSELSSASYKLTYDIGIEAGGTAKTVRFNCIQVLNYYPAGTHYYNCLIQSGATQTITLNPGQTTQLEQTFTLSGASLNDKGNVSYIAWVQENASSAPAYIHNADSHEHGQLPPVTLSVGPSGDYQTISEAVENAGSGSTIYIAPGTYFETINPEGRSIALIGTGGAQETIIDGAGSGPIFDLMNGEDSDMVLQGLTIQNGDAEITGGVKCNGTPIIQSCIIRNNGSDYLSGGVSSAGSPGPTINDTLFCNNEIANTWGNWTGSGNTFEDTCEDSPSCPGDYDGNNQVNIGDLLNVIDNWGSPYTVLELLDVIGHWNETCP